METATFNDIGAVVEADRKHVWHHLTQHKPFETVDPRVIVEGKGLWVWDATGKKTLDAVSGAVWTVNVGYGRESIANAVRDQLVKMNYFAGAAGTVPGAIFAQRLIDKMPGMSRVYYSNSGSEANEKAYKMVRQIAHRQHGGKKWKILYRERDYHGTTIAALASGGQEERKAMYGPFPDGFVAVPHCLEYRSQWGEVEQQPLSGIRRKTAENMSLAWRLVPHVTQYDVADVTELEAARKKYVEAHRDQPGKITMTALAIKSSIAALRQFPQFNSSLDEGGGNIIIKKYFHIGVAVDTENGLLVPTLMDADRKSLVELAVEMEQIAEKARQRKLTPEQMQGGTFTISNLGGIGGTAFTPIVYHPQVAILGMSRARKEQVIIDDEPRIRLILPLSLSYDHRVIDGADGARFLRKVCQALSDPMQLLLEA